MFIRILHNNINNWFILNTDYLLMTKLLFFVAKIVVDFGFESVIIDCLYSGTFLIEQLKKYDIFDIKINKLSTVLIQFREAPLINFTKIWE